MKMQKSNTQGVISFNNYPEQVDQAGCNTKQDVTACFPSSVRFSTRNLSASVKIRSCPVQHYSTWSSGNIQNTTGRTIQAYNLSLRRSIHSDTQSIRLLNRAIYKHDISTIKIPFVIYHYRINYELLYKGQHDKIIKKAIRCCFIVNRFVRCKLSRVLPWQ